MSGVDLDTLANQQDTELLDLVKTDSKKEIKLLTTARSGKRQSATKTIAKIDYNNITIIECEFFLAKLNNIKNDLINLDEKIGSYMVSNDLWDREKFVELTSVDERYLDKVDMSIQSLLHFKNTNGINNNVNVNNDSSTFSQHKITLPHIDLPSFDGRPESYNKFIVSFENLLSKYSLSSFEKFSLLSKQLKGPAKKLVDALALKDLTYEGAIMMLNEAFSNKLEQQFSVIDRLVNLKLLPGSDDAYEWISEVKIISDQILSLKIDSEIFAQYFLWRGLNDDFRSHITAICGKSKPSIDEILGCVFEANSRYIESSKRNKKAGAVRSVSLATAVDNIVDNVKPQSSDFECKLCLYDKRDERNHKISKCEIYHNAELKVSKLNEIKGCVKCGASTHTSKFCKFRFSKPCYYCRKWHMSFLCTFNGNSTNNKIHDDKVASKSVKPKKWDKTSNNVVTLNNCTEFNDVILPTATAYFSNKKPMRVFKDLGSQTSFVIGKPSKIPNCKVIKDVDIKIMGINSEQTLKSQLVEFPIEIIGQGIKNVTAICRDKISTEFTAPGLHDLKSKLINKGYKLADTMLNNDKVSNISLLLGSDQSHLFPLTQRDFNDDSNVLSLYETPAGIMLSGSVSNYLKNIDIIPDAKLDLQ